MRVLITGGTGYIGTELVYRLNSNPAIEKIVVYDNLSRPNYNLFIGLSKLPGGKVQFIEGELLDSRKLKKILENIDTVYHLAARVTTPFADQNPHLFEQVNNWGTAELVYAVEEVGVEKFIHISSISVYGAGPEEININTPLNPRTFYGISKMRGEEHVKRLMQHIPTFIIRCGNVYGYSKSMRFDAVINKLMFDASFSGRITIHGDGQQGRAFVSIVDTVEVLEKLLKTDLPPDIYNLVRRNITINELADVLTEVYPEMEMLFVNQHLKLREIKVKPDERLIPLLSHEEVSLKEELQEFKKQFTFS